MKKILLLTFLLFFSLIKLSAANCLKGDCNNGFGTWEDKDFKYIGQFKEGFFNGQGTVIFNDGESYTGEFSNDAFNGYGTYIFLNGDTYVGDFLDGEFSGYGFHSFSNGETYEGSYLNNQRNGFGNYKFKNILVSLKMIIMMDLEHYFLITVMFMRVNLKMDFLMELVNTHIQTEL